MEELNRSQFILLVLLVTFVTSIATAIVTATLVNQAPSPITQTVNKVIEKTVETITLDEARKQDQQDEPQVIIVTQEDLVTRLVEDVSPAVVSVVATKDVPIIEQYYIDPFGQDEFFKQFLPEDLWPQFEIPQYREKGTEKREVSSGTGFFVSKDGFLLTNKHVVADTEAEYSIIMNDGRQLTAEVLARDPLYDIAILKVEEANFNFISLADSRKIKVGQTVVAIGNTLGEFQNTVSIGIVSGLDRSVEASDSTGQIEQLQMLIQTDAAVNPGNSGGPLLNLDGEAIGINTAIAQNAENVGFALPVNFAKKGIADVQEFGKIRYAFLGVVYVPVSEGHGILLTSGANGQMAVMEGSPAEKAGLKEGDIILEFNGRRIDMENTLTSLIADKRVGDTISLKVLRGEEELEILVTLDERPENM